MAFRIGQPVECVDDSDNAWPQPWLCKGQKYIIRKVQKPGKCPVSGRVDPVADVWLEGVYKGVFDSPFFASRFRALTEQKRETSISIFKEILARENHGLPSRVDYPADCEPK